MIRPFVMATAAIAFVTLPSTAMAQAAPSTVALAPTFGTADPCVGEVWCHEFKVELRPHFGNEIDAAPGDSIIDDSEGRVSLGLIRKSADGTVLTFTTGASLSPNLYDDDDRSSAFYVEGDWRRKSATGDSAITPYATYRFSTGYEGEFRGSTDTSHSLAGGFRFDDRLSSLCIDPRASLVLKSNDEGCQNAPTFAATLSGSWVDSTADAKAAISGAVEAGLTYPLPGSFSLTVSARGQGQSYERMTATGGGDREDWRFETTVSLDVSTPLRNVMVQNNPGLERIWSERLKILLGVGFVTNESNLDGKDFTRRRFVPSISWTRRF
jgi:hypothetical protein